MKSKKQIKDIYFFKGKAYYPSFLVRTMDEPNMSKIIC